MKEKIKKEIEDCLKMNVDDNIVYEYFYSKSLSIVSQLLPNRKDDFMSMYQSVNKYNEGAIGYKYRYGYIKKQAGILKAALDSLDSCIYDISQQLLYNIFDDELLAAEHLLKNGFLRASGVVVGVVLEKHLKGILLKHNIDIVEKNPALAILYTELYKNKIIDINAFRNIEWISSLRNKCSHNKESEPTKTDVEDLISGVKKIISTIN
jgi:HEPN domain-containing protein